MTDEYVWEHASKDLSGAFLDAFSFSSTYKIQRRRKISDIHCHELEMMKPDFKTFQCPER